MADNFVAHSAGLDSPASKAFAITPNDSTDLADVTRGLYTGTGGTIVCILNGDSASVTFTNVPAGTVLPLRVKRVLATGTTSSMALIGLV
jgi:hypothetical protein